MRILRSIRPRIWLVGCGLCLAVSFSAARSESEGGSPTSPVISPRVIGGSDAPRGAYPFMVALVDSSEPDNFVGQFCGGTLIDRWFVLTAAHCLVGTPASEVEVLVGQRRLSGFGGRRIGVREIIRFPDYNDFSLDGDMALLALESPVDDIEPVQLVADEAAIEPGTSARVLGWGQWNTSADNPTFPDDLQQADLEIFSLAQANAPGAWNGSLTDLMLPAAVPSGSIPDSCGGDSGGPLLVRNGADAWQQAGIVSFGDSGCGTSTSPGIYTNVLAFRSWLDQMRLPDFGRYAETLGIAAATDDGDGDGRDAFTEYALGLPHDSPVNARTPLPLLVNDGDESFLALEFFLPTTAYDTAYRWQQRQPDGAWLDLDPEALLVTDERAGVEDLAGNDLRRRVLRAPSPASGTPDIYRLAVEPTPDYRAPVQRLRWGPILELAFGDGDNVNASEESAPRRRVRFTATDARPYRLQAGSSDIRPTLTVTLPDGTFVGSDLAGTGSYAVASVPVETTVGATYDLSVQAFQASASGRLDVWLAPGDLPDVSPGQSPTGLLGSTDWIDPVFLPEEYYADFYLLTGVSVGDLIRVDMEAIGGLDTYLSVYNDETEALIDENDDRDETTTDSRVEFTVQSGVAYRIVATSYEPLATGSYRLRVTR